MLNFCVVLVTYNRLECLKIALEKYALQTKKPKYILVVNNASNDGTKEYLTEWKSDENDEYKRIVINCESNTGGSGGFCIGVEAAKKLDCDFIFLADDDAYAEPDMFEKLETGYEYCDKDITVALCTSIFNYSDYEVMHRCKIKKGIMNVKFVGIPTELYNNDKFEIDILTFVGAAIKKDAATKIGSIKKEYFIYFDDSEYSIRLRKLGKIFCIPSSIMHHDVGHDRRFSWKDYYDTRNWIDMIRVHYPKRYYYFSIILKYLQRCSILACWLRGRDENHRKMCGVAIKDAIAGKTGISDRYYPGCKI